MALKTCWKKKTFNSWL